MVPWLTLLYTENKSSRCLLKRIFIYFNCIKDLGALGSGIHHPSSSINNYTNHMKKIERNSRNGSRHTRGRVRKKIVGGHLRKIPTETNIILSI